MTRPRAEKRFECPSCEERHKTEAEAESCCAEPIEQVDGFVCGNCSEWYEDREEALECCK